MNNSVSQQKQKLDYVSTSKESVSTDAEVYYYNTLNELFSISVEAEIYYDNITNELVSILTEVPVKYLVSRLP